MLAFSVLELPEESMHMTYDDESGTASLMSCVFGPFFFKPCQARPINAI